MTSKGTVVNMKTERTPTSITVKVLDLSEPCDNALAWYQQRRARVDDDLSTYTGMTVRGAPWGYVELANGGVCLLTNEGTSDDIAPDGKYVVEYYAEGTDVDGTEFSSMVPVCSGGVTADGFRELPVSKEVNLADFIRRFGARLESNYHTQRRHLEANAAV
jgi:hypothetical protein